MAPVIFTSSEPFGTGHSLYTVLPSIEKETKGPSTVTNKELIYTGHGRGSSIACWTALDLDKANKRQDKTDFDRQWTRQGKCKGGRKSTIRFNTASGINHSQQ